MGECYQAITEDRNNLVPDPDNGPAREHFIMVVGLENNYCFDFNSLIPWRAFKIYENKRNSGRINYNKVTVT